MRNLDATMAPPKLTANEKVEVNGSVQASNPDKLVLGRHNGLLNPREGIPSARRRSRPEVGQHPRRVVDVVIYLPFRQYPECEHKPTEDAERSQQRRDERTGGCHGATLLSDSPHENIILGNHLILLVCSISQSQPRTLPPQHKLSKTLPKILPPQKNKCVSQPVSISVTVSSPRTGLNLRLRYWPHQSKRMRTPRW